MYYWWTYSLRNWLGTGHYYNNQVPLSSGTSTANPAALSVHPSDL